MVWPTTTIVTTDMDATGDDPSAARSEIKSMADNVNSMKDFPPLGSGLNAQTGTTYSVVAGDNGQIIVGEHGTNITVTLLAAATAGDEFTNAIHAGGAGTVTITRTVGAMVSPVMQPRETLVYWCNGTIYEGYIVSANKTRGTFTTGSISSGATATGSFAHGSLNEGFLIVTGKGSSGNSEWAGAFRLPDSGNTEIKFSGPDDDGTIIGGISAPTSGNVNYKILNPGPSIQTVTIRWLWII